MKKMKLLTYQLAKYCGLFHFSRWITRNKLRILCYHGISLGNEHLTFDKLFMQFETFEQRMHHLQEARYPVVSLDEGVDQLYKKKLKSGSTVITFDDGWSGVCGETSSLLSSLNFPWTLYVTTYYMEKQSQVFNIVFQHMLLVTEKTTASMVSFEKLALGSFSIKSEAEKLDFYNNVYSAANQQLTSDERQDLLYFLASELDVDIDWVFDKGCFKNITSEQCKVLAQNGVDIQLHTHRHRFPPEDLETSKQEILENKSILESITNKELVHLCYPSGEHSTSQFEMMESIGIKSATTVNVALNTNKSHKYKLTRFLDGENISPIEFEAEMSGFSEILRSVFSVIRRKEMVGG